MARSRAMVWFRRDLTIDDNLAWAQATHDFDEVLAVFVVDDQLLDAAGPWRRNHLLGAVAQLGHALTDAHGALTVLRGDAPTELVRTAREHHITHVCWNRDVTRYACARDAKVERALSDAGVTSAGTWSTLVQPPGTVTTAAGTVPKVFTRFYERWDGLDDDEAAASGGARILSVPGVALPAIEGEPRAGAEAARADLTRFLAEVDRYDETRDDLAADATSHLSAHLRFGTISPRAVCRAVGRSTPGRRAFRRQLAWRDWYAHLFHSWPDLVDHAMQPALDDIEWRNEPSDVEAWCSGTTGMPIVDAGMRQLATTGWMPNRVRMIAASFLVKDLLVDWRIGERHFRRLLVDGDVPQNAGNWQWVAGTGPDAAPYFRVLNPLTQARRFDPDGDYTRRWVAELAGLDGATVHAPWELGPLALASAGVTLGDTYPSLIVDHQDARRRTLSAYAVARERGAATA